MDIRDLYQELIIEHGTQPRNCCVLENANSSAEGFNPLCGDKVCVYLKIDNVTIEKATFTGAGCAISMASASLMSEAISGKDISEILDLSLRFKECLTSDSAPPLPGKLAAFAGVREYPARVKCATLAWHTLEAAIKKSASTITTEAL